MRLRSQGSWWFSSSVLFASAASVLWSCRDRAAPISGEHTAPSSSAPAVDAAPSDLDAAVDSSDADVGAPFDAGPLKPAVKIGDAGKWLTDRGAKISPYDGYGSFWDCVELAVGTMREAALVCSEVKNVERGNPADPANYVYRVIEHRIARVVRTGQIVKVLDAEMTLTPLDKEMSTQPNILDLGVHLAPDGMSATIDDRGTGLDDCVRVQRANASGKSPNPTDAWSLFDRDLSTRMCNARGGYVWQGDRFVRDPNWKAPPPSASKPRAAPTSTTRMSGRLDPF